MTTTPNNTEPMSCTLQPDHEGRMMALGLLALLGFELILIVGIMVAAGVRFHEILLISAFVLGFTLGLLFAIARIAWIPWQRRYPKQPVRDGAVARSMQSFSLGGLARFNNGLRVIVDEDHLHLCAMAFLGPFGAQRISIPWERITDVRPSWFSGYSRARLDGRTIMGPTWCLKLAADDSE